MRSPCTTTIKSACSNKDPAQQKKKKSTNEGEAQMVKNLPAMQETWVQSLGQEDLLKKGMATHSGFPEVPW